MLQNRKEIEKKKETYISPRTIDGIQNLPDLPKCDK